MSRLLRVAAVVAALLLVPMTAWAQPAVQSFSGGSQFTSFDSNGDTVGWFFNVNSPITATHLGFWDAGQNGLAASHEVAIWNAATQALLGTVTVQAGTASPLIGQWRYEPLNAPVALAAGTEYVVGAYYHVSPIDNYITTVSGIVTIPEITMTASARDPFPAGGGPNPLAFPSIRGAANGRFGPNFLIPEPASLGLLAFGAVALLRRRV